MHPKPSRGAQVKHACVDGFEDFFYFTIVILRPGNVLILEGRSTKLLFSAHKTVPLNLPNESSKEGVQRLWSGKILVAIRTLI